MDTQLFCFVAEKSTSFTDEIDVPSAGSMDASCKGGYTPDIADTKGTIFVLLVGRFPQNMCRLQHVCDHNGSYFPCCSTGTRANLIHVKHICLPCRHSSGYPIELAGLVLPTQLLFDQPVPVTIPIFSSCDSFASAAVAFVYASSQLPTARFEAG